MTSLDAAGSALAAASGSTEELGGSRSLTKKGALTRARILAAAKEVFEEDGLLDARISDITARAKVAQGTFYAYFTSKQEIFREVALRIDDDLGAPLGDVILDRSSTASPRDRIREAIRLYLERYRQEARIMGVIEQVSRHDPLLGQARAERGAQERKRVAESIGRLQRHGLVDTRLDPTITAAVLGSMTSRFPELWLSEGRLDCTFDQGVEHLTAIFMNALNLRDVDEADATPAAPSAGR
jgi:AcrR family transcriptional regulator